MNSRHRPARSNARVLSALALGATLVAAQAGAYVAQASSSRAGVVALSGGTGKAVALLGAVAFATPLRGWVGGEHVILATSDGGHSWTRRYAGTETIQQLDVAGAAVWALGTRTLLRTSDGGQTWQAVGDPHNALRQVNFVSPTQGWGIASSATAPSSTLYHALTPLDGLYRTQDGGVVWRRQATPQPIDSLCFLDATHGWVAVAGRAGPAPVAVYATADGGATWRATALPPGLNGLGGFEAQTLGCAAPNALWDLVSFGGYAGGVGYALYRSADGGAHWRVVAQNMALPNIPSAHGPGTQPQSLAVTSAATAHLTGACGPCGGMGTTAVGGTTDGGVTWRNYDVAGLPYATTALSFPTAQDGWMVAQWFVGPSQYASAVFATANGGVTWTRRYQS